MRKMPTFIVVMVVLLALAVCQCQLPGREMSELENRVLAQKPTFTLQSFWSGTFSTELETFAADQLPLRDQFVTVYAAMQSALGRRLVNDALLGADGFLFDTSAVGSTRNVLLNTEALLTLGESAGSEVYLLAVPSAAGVYADKVPAGAAMMDEEALLQEAGEQMNLISLLPEMRQAQDQLLYYKTDHHWTAAGARIGYEAVCEALGLESLGEAEVLSRPGFYGSFYARYALPWLAGDVLTFEVPAGIRLLIDGEEQPSLVDESLLAGRDKYASLLYGNHGVIELVNDSVAEGELLVIKDSYANALLPVLARHYHRIIAVDPRYFAGNITELADQYEEEIILCVCGINTLAASRTIALMEGF